MLPNLRNIISYLIILLFVAFWVVTVFWTDLIFTPQISTKKVLSSNIFLNDKKLKENYIFYISDWDLSKYNIKSECDVKSKFIWSNKRMYVFKIIYLNKCNNWIISLKTENGITIKNSYYNFNIISKNELWDSFVDLDNVSLNKIRLNIRKQILQYDPSLYKTVFKKEQRKKEIIELNYKRELIKEIIELRKLKYLIPVNWYKISDNKNELPNAGRPYRKDYTDWIHHWWDIKAPLYTPVVAIDKWIIIKIVKDFNYYDLSNIKKYWILTKQDEINNLDILRWNQVWLKTSKWDVIFYSHLSSVKEKLKIWNIVYKWEELWKIWISWVPDKNYKNFHLHFSIMKNPYLKEKIWKYNEMDYLNWDWYFKWKSLNYVLENSKNIFK